MNSTFNFAWVTAASAARMLASLLRTAALRLVDLLLADALDGDELLGAAQVGLAQVGGGAGGGGLRLGAGELGLERTRVDGEERVALLDDLAFAEVDLVECSGDTGADLDGVGRFQARGDSSKSWTSREIAGATVTGGGPPCCCC